MSVMTQPFDLTLHHIRLTCEVETTVHFGVYAGAQWRGALWEALQSFACTDPSQQGRPEHSWHCPMCFVLALEAESSRGVNPARPLIIRPPLAVRATEESIFELGESFTVDLILVDRALSVFPYLLQAVRRMGHQGIGFGRGRFLLRQADAYNPLTRHCSTLYEAGQRAARMPDQPVNREQVAAFAASLPTDRLRLHFLTPTQLVHEGKLLSRPQPDVLIMRVLERLQALEYHYGFSTPENIWKERHETLSHDAKQILVRRDETRWVRAFSRSRRANRAQDVSGFVGSVFLEGNIQSLQSWLVWGSLVNVGKNAIKGNGWFEVSG